MVRWLCSVFGLCPELAAGCGDVLAFALAQGAGHAFVPEKLFKGENCFLGWACIRDTWSGIEGDEVHLTLET